MPEEELTPEELAAIALEKESLDWYKGIFQQALNEFTTIDQAINYIANQPRQVFDETIAKIDADLELHTNNRDAEAARVIELQKRKQVLLDARN